MDSVLTDLRNSTLNVTVNVQGGSNTPFVQNAAGYEQGSLAFYNCDVTFSKNSYFKGNTANRGGVDLLY